ncbi:MAG: 23S rRNA (adenine(2503)-C(2))-methyltransferase RlmN [Bdellovibrionales bacterium]|nr:23S rRNA (adenine(2503)-C(2))-methyltransferase RlmN [Bdellovibrionales bacterium]
MTNTSENQHNFYGFTLEALEEFLVENLKQKSFRAKQLFQWVYQRDKLNFEDMTDLSKELRGIFNETFYFLDCNHESRAISKDGTRKYLFKMDKNDLIESVMIKQEDRMTLCVSSQVGCALGCKFCQTGTMGLKRNLTTAEIIKQFVGVKRDSVNFNDMYSNVVFMGMGEPLHNYKGVTEALKIITSDFGLGLSGRKITVSSVGLVPAIAKFGKSGIDVNLAISLNATTDEIRSKIMPVNDRYNISTLLGTLREYPLKRRKKFTIEYVMLKDLNDTDADLKRLPLILKDLPVKINLIPYNENAGLGFHEPLKETVFKWQRKLLDQGLTSTIRWSKGRDIDAACGQLVTATKQEKTKNNISPIFIEKIEQAKRDLIENIA